MGGEGLIEEKFLDKFGCEWGHHPQRLPFSYGISLSHQSRGIFQTFRGSQGMQDGEKYMMRLMDCSVLEAPYDSANLPLLTLSNLSWPHCFWMNVSFSKI